MRINSYYKFVSVLLIFLSISSFLIGFIYGENSAGAGSLLGDFVLLWKNLQTFLNNDLATAIAYTTSLDHENYQSSRTPLLYIFHKLFNPFVDNQVTFIRSVFIFSLITPFLFYFCLRQKFKNEDVLLLILISSTLCLSPYFRTSSFWGLEENFGIICLLLSFIFLSKFISAINKDQKYHLVFLITFVSSLCLYFDQKLAIIPLLCFIKIFFSEANSKIKILTTLFYFIFSLPYIYLIINWGSLIPTGDASARGIGNQIYMSHLGYSSTIIGFYLLPFLLFKKETILNLVISFFREKNNYYYISSFFIYFIYLLFFYDYENELSLGKGYIHKTAIILFDNVYFQKVFIFLSFFISWIVILIFLNNNFKDKLIIFYFFILSIIIYPILQEYFDPIIILMVFTFFNTKLILSYKSSILFFLYLSILTISSNIYYYNLLN